jgi:hypothetical protein
VGWLRSKSFWADVIGQHLTSGETLANDLPLLLLIGLPGLLTVTIEWWIARGLPTPSRRQTK